MVIKVGAKAFHVVLQKEGAEELGTGTLHRNKPGQGYREIQQDSGRPKGAENQPPILSQGSKDHNDQPSKQDGNRTLSQGSESGKEIERQQPAPILVGIPPIPAQHCGGKHRRQRQVGGSAPPEPNHDR